jgi:hypothetical protein
MVTTRPDRTAASAGPRESLAFAVRRRTGICSAERRIAPTTGAVISVSLARNRGVTPLSTMKCEIRNGSRCEMWLGAST